ncbi:hypothetical protein GRAQ_04573 [Rahnella aquatilis CIP 78.65 = ATCC 33071]|uniref:hypothetical protein n=1 Tax=Rahnella aquatilis TaxID=34038 RepID=UPI0002E8A651|nr:hypothetical protein [Rahnella aquatilis]KFD00139.1 hypothetical protein GRAQ_04573 [Rahnella aquatilis CIP 78.65 = ATCC 33071]
MTGNDIDLFRERLTVLVRSLQIAPDVAENQVLDRVALSFRKLLNFLAENTELTQQIFLLPPLAKETQRLLASLMSENLTHNQQCKLFRSDIPAFALAQCFTGMLVQLAQDPADPEVRHQNSQACAKLFCEGVWLRE